MKAKTTGTLAIAAVAAAVVLVLACCRSAAVEAAFPVERANASLVRRAWRFVRGAWRGAAASAETARLRRDLAALAVLRSDFDRLAAENDRLRKALGLAERSPAAWMAASVLSRGGGAAGAGRTIRVDRGSIDGVRKGAAVVVPDGLVGLVTAVTPHTAQITLLTDPSVKAACELEVVPSQGAPSAPMRGVVSGGTDEILVMRYLSPVGRTALRARVVTSGLGGVFPKGLEIGTLLDFREDETGLVREGEVMPSVDYLSLEEVFIRREN